MRYLMFVCNDPDPDPGSETPGEIDGWLEDVEARGKRVIGDRVRPAEDASTVRVRAGELLVTDGPFTEAKDWIAGFDVLDCEDLDEAIEIASKHPAAGYGSIEIRPVWAT